MINTKKLIILLFLCLSSLWVFSEENTKTNEEDLTARYVFDLNRSDKLPERIAAIEHLFAAQKYDILKKNIDIASDGHVRNAILAKLGTLKDKAYLDMFIRFLDFRMVTFWETRYTAVEALENYQDKEIIPYLLETAEKDPYWEVKARAALAVMRTGQEQDINKIIEMFLRVQDTEEEYQLALALSYIDVPLTSAALYGSWQNKQQRLVTAITYVMGIRNYPEAFPILLQRLDASDEGERAAAYFAVSLYPQNDPQVAVRMRTALFDRDEEIRKIAIFYAALKNDAESLEPLHKIMETAEESAAIRDIVCQALKQMGVIGRVVSIQGNQLVASVGSKYGLDTKMEGTVIRQDPYLEAGNWQINSLNSMNSVLVGPKDILAAINEDKNNYQVIFLFPQGNYLNDIYHKLNLEPWVKRIIIERKYAFAK